MLVPTAILAGYLVGSLRRFAAVMYVAGTLVLGLAAWLGLSMLQHNDVVTYDAARPTLYTLHTADQARVTGFLSRHYTGGEILMESFGNENIAFAVPSAHLVYEGSYRQWQLALQQSARSHIQWIVARCGTDPDLVCTSVTTARAGGYRLAYQPPDHSYRVYELTGGH